MILRLNEAGTSTILISTDRWMTADPAGRRFLEALALVVDAYKEARPGAEITGADLSDVPRLVRPEDQDEEVRAFLAWMNGQSAVRP